MTSREQTRAKGPKRRRGRGPSFRKVVLTPSGERDIRIVAALRLLTATCTAVALIATGSALGRAWNGQEPAALWIVAACGAVFAGCCAFAEIKYGGAAARAEERRIRHRLLEVVFRSATLPRNNETEFTSARLITLMTDNLERLTEYRQTYYGATLASIAIPFLTLGYVAIAIDPVVGLLIMALCPLIPVLIIAFRRAFRKTSARSRSERAKLAGRYLDAIRNLVTIRLLGAGPRIETQLREQGEKNRGAIMRLLAGNQVVIIVMDGLFSLALICCTAAVTVARVHSGAVTVSQALTIMLLAALLLEPLIQVAGFFYIGMGGMAAERAIGRYLTSAGRAASGTTTAAGSSTIGVAATADTGKQAASTVQATASEAPMATAAAAGSAAPAREFPAVDPTLAIQADHLTYDYGRGPVLHGVDLAVPQGGKVAIVGRSGAGKSTLLALLRGSQPLQGGRLLLGGEDAADHDAAWIRRQSASVAQTTWLFTTTIAENLRLARPDASEDELWAALRKAHVAEDIERMPLGLSTLAGEEGALISGGQAQRLSLARAFLSGRRTLLLDEPTSQIDMESEAHIIDAIAELDRDWTVLIVTHRPSLLRLADQVWELDNGVLRAYEDAETTAALRHTTTEGEGR